MKPQGKVLLVERVIPTDRTAELHVLESDVIMLVVPGGKERTEAEYRALLEAAGPDDLAVFHQMVLLGAGD